MLSRMEKFRPGWSKYCGLSWGSDRMIRRSDDLTIGCKATAGLVPDSLWNLRQWNLAGFSGVHQCSCSSLLLSADGSEQKTSLLRRRGRGQKDRHAGIPCPSQSGAYFFLLRLCVSQPHPPPPTSLVERSLRFQGGWVGVHCGCWEKDSPYRDIGSPKVSFIEVCFYAPG